MQKLFLEDLQVGDRFFSSEYVLTAEKLLNFAQVYDPQLFHLDPLAAEKHPVFHDLAGSGWQTSAIMMRLCTECFPVAGGLLGINAEVKWKKPTRINDRLRIEIELLSIRPSNHRPAQGYVSYQTITKNQHDEVVMEATATILVWSKSATTIQDYLDYEQYLDS
ncbi:dehydratase [Acinetobacter qingfengensis]|uniref:Dehydratase n=1 Tax=Acinetobacter qingfengensis TaxID=1262585 RepID=A0A1E7QWK8_9GAMM|nr:MaoC/PaaZ C-terminal domain-containing protein [Acinetobacter qingfengensis]KAA8731273.1 dehydratase [Acinetobacter qingfengensis]OEY91480.1 dehydratase [Acinetobacter qingfengensis]